MIMKIFISYAEPDQVFAKDLARRLSQEGLAVWNPHEELSPGDNWASEIGEALAQSDAVLVLLSPDSVGSEWVRHEIEYALGSMKLQDRLLPVVVRPTEKIPWILERLRPVRIEDDPLAVGERVVKRLKQMSTASDSPSHGSA
jgi:TIR domain